METSLVGMLPEGWPNNRSTLVGPFVGDSLALHTYALRRHAHSRRCAHRPAERSDSGRNVRYSLALLGHIRMLILPIVVIT